MAIYMQLQLHEMQLMLFSVYDSAGILSWSHQTYKQRWASPRNSAVLGYSGRTEVQEVHRSSQEGVTSYCWAKWGCYWFLEVECPLENSAFICNCCVFKLFFVVCLCFFFFFWSCWCFDPGTPMCHDICRQEVAFIYFALWSGMASVLKKFVIIMQYLPWLF